jgi:hypothetical protein
MKSELATSAESAEYDAFKALRGLVLAVPKMIGCVTYICITLDNRKPTNRGRISEPATRTNPN